MTSSKHQCHLSLPDHDPSIALAQATRQDFERPAIHQLIEQAKRDRAQYTAALLRRFVARLRSTFQISTSVTPSVRSDVKAR